MTSHITVPTIAEEQTLLPNQPFFSWVKSHTTLFISQIVAILGFVSLPASTVYYVKHEGTSKWVLLRPEIISVVVDYVHILFIVIAVLALIRVINDNERGSYRVGLVYQRVFDPSLPEDYEDHKVASKLQLRRFKIFFLCFWIAMFGLYVSLAFEHTYKIATTQASPIVPAEQRPESLSFEIGERLRLSPAFQHKLHGADLFKDLGFPFLTFALNNFSVLFIFWCYVVLSVPRVNEESRRRQRQFLWWSTAVITVLTALFPIILLIGRPALNASGRNAYVGAFDALSGTLNAIIFALLIARLDSKLIGLRSWLICILYSYAAVQPLFVVFGQDSDVFKRIMTTVLIFVLVSKIYFFLIIMYALQTGRMLNYLFCYPFLDQKVNTARDGRRHRNPGWFSRWTTDVTGICKLLGILALIYFFGSLINYVAVWGGLSRFARFLPSAVLWLAQSVLYPSNVVIDIAQMAFVLMAAVVVWTILRGNHPKAQEVRDISGEIFPEAAQLKSGKRSTEEIRQTTAEVLPETPSSDVELPNRATDQLRKFKTYFAWFWIITFPLYAMLLWKHLGWSAPLGHQPHGFLEIVKVLWNPFFTFFFGTFNLMFLFWCFVVLQSPVYGHSPKTRQQLLFDRYEVRQRLLLHYSAVVVGLLIVVFPLLLVPVGGGHFTEDNLKDYATVFDGVTGTLSAVALSLLVARLDSKLIDLSPSLIYLFFSYSAIQPLLVVFGQSGEVFRAIETAVLTSAFLLKICFFLVTLHVLRDGSMLIYLVCFPFLHKRVDDIFENQFEIRIFREKADSFSFSIWKRNHLVYLPGTTFKSRRRCDKRISRLQELMKDSKNYEFSDASGTHWLSVVDSESNDRLMCESIALRSREDAEELRDESIEKIPFCKYDRS